MWNGLIIDRRNLFEPRRCALWTSEISLLLILRNKLLLGYYQKTFPQKHNKYLNCTQPRPKLEIQMLLICGRMKTRHEPKQRTKTNIFKHIWYENSNIAQLQYLRRYFFDEISKKLLFTHSFCKELLNASIWHHRHDNLLK